MAGYDIVVIGSGIGGLTCGAFLAKQGMRVLVLEQHSKIGGYTHNFKRKQFTFESAVHSVPLAKNGLVMHLLRKLGIDEQIITIPHKTMFGASFSGTTYSVPATYDEIISKLIKDFPHQKENLHKLFAEMFSFYQGFVTPIQEDSLMETDSYKNFIKLNLNKTYKQFIDSYINDDTLRLIFYSQWPFGGSIPSRAPVAFYVLMFIVHAIEGSHYIQGGFNALATLLGTVITSNGGEIRTKSKVQSLEVSNRNVTHAVLNTNERLTADYFISNVSPYHLHNKLIQPQNRNKIWQRRLSNLNPSVSAVIVYLGLKSTINDILPDCIHFWFGDSDENIYDRIQNDTAEEIDHLIFLKSPPESNEQTLTIMNFLKKSLSQNWKQDKKILAEKVLTKAESLLPGLRSKISLIEIGSPATFERYTENTNGSIYGFENTNSVYGEAKLPIKTYLENLFQTGHWGKPGGGIWNAMYNGYSAALQLINQRTS